MKILKLYREGFVVTVNGELFTFGSECSEPPPMHYDIILNLNDVDLYKVRRVMEYCRIHRLGEMEMVNLLSREDGAKLTVKERAYA